MPNIEWKKELKLVPLRERSSEFLYADLEHFIETLLEEVINEIPNDMQTQTNGYRFKQSLLSKYLGK